MASDLRDCMDTVEGLGRRLDAMQARRRDRREDATFLNGRRLDDDVELLSAQERERQFR